MSQTLENHSVGDVAKLARVSIRTLHHYDEIGLLSPSDRTHAGYRRYSADDLVRLQRILCYRALGFDLRKIAAILNDPHTDEVEHLRRQRALLETQIGQLHGMVKTVEKMLEARKMGINLDPEEMFEVFGDFDPAEHAQEAEDRWGETDAYKESHRRTSKYTKDDWKRITAEAESVAVRLANAMKAGLPPSDPDVMDLAEQHRQHISRWFYSCSYEIHRGLGDMYVGDPRFAANYDKTAKGLSGYIREAIHANADRAESH